MSMEKKRIRPVKSGRSLRMSYSRQKEVLDMPNLIEVQRNSYEWFLSDGLKEALDDISPIEDYSQNLSLESLTSSYVLKIRSIRLRNVKKEMQHMQLL